MVWWRWSEFYGRDKDKEVQSKITQINTNLKDEKFCLQSYTGGKSEFYGRDKEKEVQSRITRINTNLEDKENLLIEFCGDESGFDFNIREIGVIRDKKIFCLKIFNITACGTGL